MDVLKDLNSDQLKKLLNELLEYQDMTKKLWERGRKLFVRELTGIPYLMVEYYPSLEIQDVYESAKEVYEKMFSIEPKMEQIHFVSKPDILWGMKVYKDDQMVDMSFSKVEKQLKK